MNSFKVNSMLARLPIWGGINEIVQSVRYRQWLKQGKPMPPPHKVKQRVLEELRTAYDLNVLVETGTLFGDMVYAMRNRFKAIYSIEVYRPLYERAVKRFRHEKRIQIMNGDSGVVLGDLVKKLDQPTLFWLDGHYSGEGTGKGAGDTPIYQELLAIFSSTQPFAVAIDDARLFGVDPAYPSLEDLTDFVHEGRAGLEVNVENDIIQITLSSSGQDV